MRRRQGEDEEEPLPYEQDIQNNNNIMRLYDVDTDEAAARIISNNTNLLSRCQGYTTPTVAVQRPLVITYCRCNDRW